MGYIDWSITVPLQMIEFNLILKAAKAPISAAGFWKLFVGTVLMLSFGYAGETNTINRYVGFALGMCGWFLSSSKFSQVSRRALARQTTYPMLSGSRSATCG